MQPTMVRPLTSKSDRWHDRCKASLGDMNTSTCYQAPAGQQPCHVSSSCEAPTAEAVRLVGDFNGWDLVATRMRRTACGHWIASLALKPGSYTYVFIVDGNLTLDPNANVTSGNEQVSRITIS